MDAPGLLGRLQRFGVRPGLERTRRLLRQLGHPERKYRVLHVAGTNGKGSTCAIAAALLEAMGLRVGLYTSPHLVRYEERIRVAGQPIPAAELDRLLQRMAPLLAAAEASGDPVTEFEAATVAALLWFQEAGVEVAVLETGLGGRFDATNAVAATASAVTAIDLDHTDILGDTVLAIARDKAGIIKANTPVVLAPQADEALGPLLKAAARVQAPVRRLGQDAKVSEVRWDWQGTTFTFEHGASLRPALRTRLIGRHQAENAAVACLLVEAAGFQPTDEQLRLGLLRAEWPGRVQVVQERPWVVLDCAHNPHGARALAETMSRLTNRRIHLVFGILADKDVAGVAAALAPLARRVETVAPASSRALSAEAAAAAWRAAGVQGPVTAHGTVPQALAAGCQGLGPDDVLLICGSTYLIGPALSAFGGLSRPPGGKSI